MDLQGIALAGLDEFMLRLGHLTMLADVSREFGGYIHRVEKNLASRLTELQSVDCEDKEIIDYLRVKRLCRIDGIPEDASVGDVRYPSIDLRTGPPERLLSDDGPPQIWWQDICLSQSDVASRVGAVTASGRSGSKKGITHILDWAIYLGLMSSNGEPSADANLISWLCSSLQNKANPYVLGVERLVYANSYFRGDIDVAARYCARLLELKQPFDKKAAVDAFLGIMADVSDDAAASDRLTARSQFALLQVWRDLSKGTRTGSKGGSRSTAWHRCSSRLEMLTDLGLLAKTAAGGLQKYEYRYNVTSRLSETVASMQATNDLDDWIDRYLADSVFDGRKLETFEPTSIDTLRIAVESVGVSVGLVPISTLALSLVAIEYHNGRKISVGQARDWIEECSRRRADVVRLARGNTGDRAEFVSINLRKLND